MPSVDLIFDGALLRSTDLIFGGEPAAPPASEPGAQVSGSVSTGWQRAETVADAVRTTQNGAEPRSAAVVARWRDHAHRSSSARSVWADAVGVHTSVSSWWTEHLRCQAAVRSGWGELQHLRTGVLSRWQRGQGAQRVALVRWQRAAPAAAGWSSAWRSGAVVHAGTVIVWQRAQGADVSVRSWWQRAMRPPPGYWQPPVDPGELPLTPHDLIFCGPWTGSTDLIFGDDDCAVGISVPIKRTYIVINDVSLSRVSDGLPIQCFSLSLQIDSDSWTYGWSATLHSAAIDAILPAGVGSPVEVEASINGTTFRLLCESISRDRQFPSDRIRVTGRGIAAVLSDPYNPVVTRNNIGSAMTAQQLADAALTVSGVGIGWSIDWGLTDWLVPAGAWNHNGTMIEAVNRIASAAGGYVFADRVAQGLSIRPRWPVLPWELATTVPDISLSAAPNSLLSLQLVERPDYNGVWISGESQGVLGHVRRTGTIGDVIAPMITDPLITHADAARQRGRSVLAETGRSALLTLSLQVLPETGIFQLGTILRFDDGADTRTGIVRSVAVSYQHPRLRQTIEVECHA